jgi:hypothetical protein
MSEIEERTPRWYAISGKERDFSLWQVKYLVRADSPVAFHKGDRRIVVFAKPRSAGDYWQKQNIVPHD